MFLSVSLAVASGEAKDLAELDRICGRFFDETGWRPDQVLHVAGAFRFTQYDFFKSLAMRWIAHRQGQDIDPTKDREYTDWQALRRAVLALAGPAEPG
jgi:menaquinone-dependent protoporphyrinogen oxidase